jgi:hypothetical protein
VNHIVEIWEMVRDDRPVCVPSCLVCGWTGTGGSRPKAEGEGTAHEEGRAQADPRGGITVSGPATGPRPTRSEPDSAGRST